MITYKIEKGNAGFVAYASTIMYQHYVRLTRKQDKNHIGRSVTTVSIEDVHSNTTNEVSISAISKIKMRDNVYADNSSDISKYESREYIKEKLELLKSYDPIVYEVIVLRFYGQLSQLEIVAKMSTPEKKRNKTWVSRQIKKGKKFLKGEIPEEEYKNIIKDLNK